MATNNLQYYWFPNEDTESAVLMVDSNIENLKPIANFISLDLRSNFTIFKKRLYWHINKSKTNYIFIGNYCTCEIENNKVFIYENDEINFRNEYSLDTLIEMIDEWEEIFLEQMNFYEFSNKKTRSKNRKAFSYDCTRNLIRIYTYYISYESTENGINDDKVIDIIKMSIIKCSTVYMIKTDILIASVIEVLLVKHKLLMLSSQFIDFLEENEKYYTNQNKFISLTSDFYLNLANLLQFIIFNEKASLITP